jgi:hypothetical protein
VPVIPAGTAPALVPLDGGRFATQPGLTCIAGSSKAAASRLTPDRKAACGHHHPATKADAAESVSALFRQRPRRGRVITRRQQASAEVIFETTDMLKGKTDRFRQNLLGKARRLFRSFGHRGRSDLKHGAACQEDAQATVHLPRLDAGEPVGHRQAIQAHGPSAKRRCGTSSEEFREHPVILRTAAPAFTVWASRRSSPN